MSTQTAVTFLHSTNRDALAVLIAAAILAGKQALGGVIETREGYGITMVTLAADVAITATTGGGTTGLIPAGTRFCSVTSASANDSITLPAGTIGDVIDIKIGGTGCELIGSVALDKVNDVVVGTTNELALTADAIYTAKYVAANKWIVTGETKLGARIAALVPDALA
jgi:hypothetical protein